VFCAFDENLSQMSFFQLHRVIRIELILEIN